jgi:hypothetical protein
MALPPVVCWIHEAPSITPASKLSAAVGSLQDFDDRGRWSG